MAALVSDWLQLKSAGGDAGDLKADPVAAMTNGHVVVMHVPIIPGSSAIIFTVGDRGLLVVLIVLTTPGGSGIQRNAVAPVVAINPALSLQP